MCIIDSLSLSPLFILSLPPVSYCLLSNITTGDSELSRQCWEALDHCWPRRKQHTLAKVRGTQKLFAYFVF